MAEAGVVKFCTQVGYIKYGMTYHPWRGVVIVMWHIFNLTTKISLKRLKLETSNFVYWLAMWSISLGIDNLCNTPNSENIVGFNYSMFTHKSESSHSLWFTLYCQRWRTSQGHRQSHSRILQKW